MPACGSEAAGDCWELEALLRWCGCLGYPVAGLWWPGGGWFAQSPAAAGDEPTAVATFSIPTQVTLSLSCTPCQPVQQLLGNPPSSPCWELTRVLPPCGDVRLEPTRPTCPSCFWFLVLAEMICLDSCLSLLTISSLSSGRILAAAIARGKRWTQKIIYIAQKPVVLIFSCCMVLKSVLWSLWGTHVSHGYNGENKQGDSTMHWYPVTCWDQK